MIQASIFDCVYIDGKLSIDILFSKEYTLLIIKNLFPVFNQSISKQSFKNMVTVGVWLLILCTSCSIEDPFAVTDLIVSIVGTVAVFLMPVLCWIQIKGGFGYVFTLGLFNDYQRHEANKQIIDIGENRVKSLSYSNNYKPSVISMLSAQFVFWLSCAFIIIGVTISCMEIYQNNIINGGGIGWRQNIFDFPRYPDPSS